VSEIVDLLEDNQIFHTRLCKDVTIETRQCIYAEAQICGGITSMRFPLCRRPLINGSFAPPRGASNRSDECWARPEAIGVNRLTRTVSDGIAKSYDCRCGFRCRHTDVIVSPFENDGSSEIARPI
jgi:hypothetical protein